MKYVSLLLVLALLLTATLIGCHSSSSQKEKQTLVTSLEESMGDYLKTVQNKLPDDLRLTIYYLDPTVLTRAPLSKEDLQSYPGVVKITVEAEELASHRELMKKLDPNILQLVQEESHINARLYYFFEVGDSEKILEVIISNIYGSVCVNDFEVENNPVFYDLILPFLEDEDRQILGI